MPDFLQNNQKGFSPFLLVAVVAVLLFLIVTSLVPFRDKFLSTIFPKQFSFAASTITVDANSNVHPISPYIYGTAANTDAWQKTMGSTVTRWGGNQVSRYNWETEDSNAGADWGLCLQPYLNRNFGAFSNVDYGPSSNSGFSIRDSVLQGRGNGQAQLFTVPNVGWVAKDGSNNTCSTNVASDDGPPLGSVSNDEAAISGYDPTSNRNLTSIKSQMKKGSAFVYPPNKTDGVVYQDELINWIVGQVGRADNGGIKFYAFDNEYDLWNHTHRDIHPAQTGYDALWNKFSVFANSVKDVDPTAMTTGPVSWGWLQYWTAPLGSADRQAHGNVPLLKWFLRQAKNAETQTGRRILDVLDVHYYPQSGQYGTDVSANMQALRLRSTRELWDPTYVTESWQSCCEGGPQIQIIRRLKQWIAEEYPGTKIGITEWNWGADNHINGALTIADILGIFGREDVYLANYWTSPENNSPGFWAWRMYRNYDGNFSKFGDISINASVPPADVDKASVYASKDSATGALKIMVINKQPATTYDMSLNLTNFNPGTTAKLYRYSQSDTTKINQLADVAVTNSTLSAVLPAYSINLFIIPASTGTPSPSPSIMPSPSPSPLPSPSPSVAPSPSSGTKIKIMPLGDSLTNGVGNAAYRDYLWKKLIANGYTNLDFVGTQNGPSWQNDFDRDHEGHSGYSTELLNGGVTSWVQSAQPDIVLLHIGTNDMPADSQGNTTAVTNAVTNVGQIIDKIRAIKPTVKILLAKIVPQTGSLNVITSYNNQLTALASQKNSTQSPIILVDQFTGFNASTDTIDGTHPNDQGNQKMADQWYVSLSGLLSGTSPSPSLSPIPSPAKPGDINGNGRVDIFDYNLLLTDFGSTSGIGLRSDINKNGRVDIFDYNILLTNFGQ